MNRSVDMSGATVVLTGASRGIGLEISRALAAQGANLIGIARDKVQLAQWAKEISEQGAQVEAIAFDLSDTDHIGDLATDVERCIQRLPSQRIDALINNAGIEIYRAFEAYQLEEIERVIRVNLISAMLLTRLLLPSMSSRSHIVNMASLAAKKGHPYDSAYAASKAGLLMWSHSLHQELADWGPSVSAICPGYVVDSGMLADTGVAAPWMAGRSQSKAVASAVLNAIKHRKTEVVINQNGVLSAATRCLLAIEQLFPGINALSNRWMGVTQTNQKRTSAHSFNRIQKADKTALSTPS